jgi:hypothetical protein
VASPIGRVRSLSALRVRPGLIARTSRLTSPLTVFAASLVTAASSFSVKRKRPSWSAVPDATFFGVYESGGSKGIR